MAGLLVAAVELEAPVLDELGRAGPLQARALDDDDELAHELDARGQRLQVQEDRLAQAAVGQRGADALHPGAVHVEAVVDDGPAVAALNDKGGLSGLAASGEKRRGLPSTKCVGSRVAVSSFL